MVISISETRVNYDNLLRCVFNYMTEHPKSNGFSFFILGKWPLEVFSNRKGFPKSTPDDMNFNNLIFVRDAGVFDDVARWWTVSSHLRNMNVLVTDRWKPKNLIRLEKMLPPLPDKMDVLNFDADDFIGVHCPDILSIAEPEFLYLDVNTLQIIIKSIFEMVHNDLPIKDNIQLTKFLKAYLPEILETVEATEDLFEIVALLKYKNINFNESNEKYEGNYDSANLMKIRLNFRYFGDDYALENTRSEDNIDTASDMKRIYIFDTDNSDEQDVCETINYCE